MDIKYFLWVGRWGGGVEYMMSRTVDYCIYDLPFFHLTSEKKLRKKKCGTLFLSHTYFIIRLINQFAYAYMKAGLWCIT